MEKYKLQKAAEIIKKNSHLIQEKRFAELLAIGMSNINNLNGFLTGAISQLLYEAGVSYLGYGFTFVPNFAFIGADIKEIIIPDKCIHIGSSAFEGCEHLRKVVYNGSYLNDRAFARSGLKEVPSMPNVQILPKETFAACTNLLSAKLPRKLTHIHKGCFEECYCLSEVYIPKTTIFIDRHSFYFCEDLKDIYYEGTKEEWKYYVIRTYGWKENCPEIIVHCSNGDLKEE